MNVATTTEQETTTPPSGNSPTPADSLVPSSINDFDVSSISNENIAGLLRSTNNGVDVDLMIAGALNKLSLRERDQVYNELHGVDDIIKEKPQLLREKFEALDSKLMLLNDTHPKRLAFSTALEKGRNHVMDQKNLLRFLRAESFDVDKAADRMVRFYDLKSFLFGTEKLCQEITLKDMSNEDKKSIQSGFIQLLPTRDRAGRAIMVMSPTFQTYTVPENMTRALYYIFMSALDDEETQKRGLALIIYDVGKFNPTSTNPRTVVQGSWLQSCVPAKTCSLHHCFSDPAFRLIVTLSMRFFGEETKARARMHQGGHVELRYALMTFGIPPDALSISEEGELKRKNHTEFLKMRTIQEGDADGKVPLSSQPLRIVVPTSADILFGRGKPFREHMGNIKLFNLLDDNLHRYDAAKMKDKSLIIAEMVDLIQGAGGRFLMKEDKHCWSEVDIKLAKEKVSHAFRTRLRIAAGHEGSTPAETPSRSTSYQDARINEFQAGMVRTESKRARYDSET